MYISAVSSMDVNEGRNESDELREIFVLLTRSSSTQSPAFNSFSPDTDGSPHIPSSDR